MKREEAYKLNTHATGVLQDKRWKEAVDKIYDDISAQTCSTCKYMKYGYNSRNNMSFCNADDTLVDSWQNIEEMNRFSCNKWEKQDDIKRS